MLAWCFRFQELLQKDAAAALETAFKANDLPAKSVGQVLYFAEPTAVIEESVVVSGMLWVWIPLAAVAAVFDRVYEVPPQGASWRDLDDLF